MAYLRSMIQTLLILCSRLTYNDGMPSLASTDTLLAVHDLVSVYVWTSFGARAGPPFLALS